MNSTAVSFLAQGNHDISHCKLQMALEGFRNVLNSSQAGAPQDDQMMIHDDSDMDGVSLYTVEIHDPQHKALNDQCMVNIYNRAFVLTLPDAQDEDDEKDPLSVRQNEHTVPAILLYNMGLSHHIQAMNSCISSQLLRKAMQLYTMSFTLLEQASDILNDMDIMVLLALSNNMGVISASQFFDRPGAETSRQMLDRILSSADCLEVLEEEDIEFFSLNLMFLTEHQQHALAAAA